VNYDWITDDMFDTKLREIAEDMDLLSIPGVYELVREHLNNDVIEELENEREDEEEEADEDSADDIEEEA
jgi:hypothetical protein